MKKVVLIMVCILVMIVFIGFNYLLWERENRENDIQVLRSSYESNTATINALNREIKSLDEDNKRLAGQLTNTQEHIDAEYGRYNELLKEKAALEKTILNKNVLINGLKRDVNAEAVAVPVHKWVESIGSKEYETAFKIQFNHKYYFGDVTSKQFAEYYQSIADTIMINSIELLTDGVPFQRDGEIILSVTLDVKLNEDISGSSYTEGMVILFNGENRLYFTILYDNYKKQWVIESISDSL